MEWEEAKGGAIRTVLVEGVPFVEIGRLVRMERNDLVVLGKGSGGAGSVERISFGSTVECSIKQSPCPLLTV